MSRNHAVTAPLASGPSYPMGPVGPGPGPPSSRGPRVTSVYFLLRHHKQTGANSNDGIEYRIKSEFSTQYIPNRGGGL